MAAHLTEVDLDDNPNYEAISYTWASPLDQQPVILNGTTINIRANLHSFLLRFRDTVSEKVLWVDALSISQTDLDEKARQVAMIGRVFKQAQRVRAWVGEHADGSQSLFRGGLSNEKNAVLSEWTRCCILFRRLRHMVFGIGAMFGTVFGLLTGGLLSWKIRIGVGVPIGISIMSFYVVSTALLLMLYFPITKWEIPFRTIPQWRAFVDRLYFRRLWIIQEVTLAKSVIVHCGDDAMEWSELVDAHLGYDETNTRARDRVQAINSHWRRNTNGNVAFLSTLRRIALADAMKRTMNILDLGFETRHTECQDPRDRLYALMSIEDQEIASGTASEIIVPDYRISVAELFVDVYRKRMLHVNGRYYWNVCKLIEVLKLTRQQVVEVWHLLNGRRERAWFASAYLMSCLPMLPASYEFTYT